MNSIKMLGHFFHQMSHFGATMTLAKMTYANFSRFCSQSTFPLCIARHTTVAGVTRELKYFQNKYLSVMKNKVIKGYILILLL